MNDTLTGTSGLDVLLRGTGGPGLLLAHGAGGGIAGNFGLVLDDLARDHLIVGPHYPGAGATPVADGPLDLDDLADRLVASAVAAGRERFAVLGESLGSAVAVRAAARHPDRVTGLVLTVGFATADPVLRVASELMVALDRAGERRAMARFATVACLTDPLLAALPAAGIEAAVDAAQAGLPPGTAAHFDLVARVDVTADLPGLSVPVLAVTAGADRLVLPATQRALAAAVPGARHVELPGAAHVLGEADRTVWLGHVREFLADHGL
ncbi:alpha/beta hydrolase [Streptomyces sp. RFCAC02]|uniref:alpha/beta fold hydrolase n=1 Tax=Streptomyces sp. RFCAC02 TaxID=2499143 RepID=UPI001020A866|nr:alpha/beta hydrolase [Streptomyces sp. RFCAC02]